MCESVGKSRASIHLEQKIGDADCGQTAFHLSLQRLGDVWKHRLVRRDAESSLGQFDIIEFADGCKTGEVSQSLIQNLALLAEIGFHVGIDGDRKWTFLAHQLKCRRGNEKAFE